MSFLLARLAVDRLSSFLLQTKTSSIRCKDVNPFGIMTITIAAMVKNQRLKTVYSMIAVILPMGRFPERLWKPPNPKMLRMDSPMKKCTAGFKTANKRLTWIITFAYPSKVGLSAFFETSFVKGANHPYACIGFTQNPHHSIYFFLRFLCQRDCLIK